jgi:hypothetical protein
VIFYVLDFARCSALAPSPDPMSGAGASSSAANVLEPVSK